ncbi:MAG: hypothetical protein JSS00_13340 [Proteobacteria bacterium]|nr:hypothetical protein [Pseudomonadota bacterium]
MKFFQIAFGVVIVALGIMMLVIAFRSSEAPGAAPGQSFIAPLSLIGAGALAITSARKRRR